MELTGNKALNLIKMVNNLEMLDALLSYVENEEPSITREDIILLKEGSNKEIMKIFNKEIQLGKKYDIKIKNMNAELDVEIEEKGEVNND